VFEFLGVTMRAALFVSESFGPQTAQTLKDLHSGRSRKTVAKLRFIIQTKLIANLIYCYAFVIASTIGFRFLTLPVLAGFLHDFPAPYSY
jgi:hypothetical protein